MMIISDSGTRAGSMTPVDFYRLLLSREEDRRAREA
jgi:hypothetical protein